MDAKNIVICSDGTGNTTIKGRGTNVFKLFEAVDVNGHRSDPCLRRQLAFYDDGVGTESFKYLRIFAGATGFGLSRNVKQLYRELCRVYEPGDAIYLFGFSRGAFTVRTLAGLVNDCGLIDPAAAPTEGEYRAQVRDAYTAYRCKYRALLSRVLHWKQGIPADEFKARFARRDAPAQPIRFLGVWDTVDAVGLPFKLADVWNSLVWQYKFETSTLGAAVQEACQALALDDERAAFSPVLWDERDASTRARVTQVWFPGAHSNVGGGYPQQGMSLVALDWMLKHAEAAGLRFVEHLREEYGWQHSFADKLYDPRAGLGIFYEWRPRDVTALAGRKGIAAPAIHVSGIERLVQAPEGYAPCNLPARCRVVTTEDHPTVRVGDLGRAIADAHGGEDAPSLLRRKAAWITVGLVSYVLFIVCLLTAIARIALRTFAPHPDVSAIAGSVETLIDPVKLARIAAADRYSLILLIVSFVSGVVISWWSSSRLDRFASGFWHRHRAAMREALRRTAAPASVGGSRSTGV